MADKTANQKVNWVDTKKESAASKEVKRLDKKQYEKALADLSKQQEKLLSGVLELNKTNPTSELYSVVTLVEQVEREFQKLR